MTRDFILRNATGEELANAVKEHLHEMLRSMVQVLNGEIEETATLGRYQVAPLSQTGFQDMGRRIGRYFKNTN